MNVRKYANGAKRKRTWEKKKKKCIQPTNQPRAHINDMHKLERKTSFGYLVFCQKEEWEKSVITEDLQAL